MTSLGEAELRYLALIRLYSGLGVIASVIIVARISADRGGRGQVSRGKMSYCNSFPRGWGERDEFCTARSSGDHHRGIAQDR